ncbi:amidase [Aureobasidium pullulans]|uniref:amidase n=1 Tax=Aureobasidium pullulans TaxID=5580 RepID=A0A4S8YXT6_AURPU|nr:amidase [Aureobasidium pullulans]THW53106.1 amidase [Aureobasidium pullulans]THW60049.1 amidase [Aureobasidium pullulans]THW80371.1 amidase [Aureobasidium pullulans]THW82367.1 amidase [Aureobasidium pullulans]
MAPDWRQIATQKRDSVLALIPEEWRIPAPPSVDEQRDVTGKFIQQYLNTQEIEITETDAVGIVEKTSNGTWTAVEVTKAFCHRSAIAHQLVNCLHEIFYDAAIESAQELDQYFAAHKKPIGPLHGLPISLKDQFHVKGVETSMGYVGWIGTFQGEKGTGKEKVYESEMVKELRNLGAVLYVKTAVPHTLMCGETTNNIIDYCWNPTNRNLSSGGSSGGEGALISLKGSPLGFGTDIGGSIRIPAAFNGLFGLRPSSGRLPYEGMANSFDGAPSILSVVGPLSSSSAGLKLAVQSILQTEPWQRDPRVHPLPWRNEQEEAAKQLAQDKKLTFAVLKHDGLCAPHPPIKRALEETVQKLESLGHKVIEWQPPSHSKLQDICVKAWGYDGGADAARAFALSGEEPKPNIMFEEAPQANATDIMRNQVEKRDAEKEYMEYWNSTSQLTGTGRPVDAIISPLAPFTAARPNKYTSYSYSVWVNVLDYSSAIVPVTKVDKNVDKDYTDFKPVSETDAKTQATYDPEIYDGAHVSLQVVCRRLEEEKVLAISEYVYQTIHG